MSFTNTIKWHQGLSKFTNTIKWHQGLSKFTNTIKWHQGLSKFTNPHIRHVVTNNELDVGFLQSYSVKACMPSFVKIDQAVQTFRRGGE